MFDLHVHTTGSDGDLNAKEIINEAKKNGISYIAITDHDTVSNVSECIKEGKENLVRVIPGVEISIDYKGGRMHMLGYGIDINNEEFIQTLEKTRNSVKNRNEKIIQILNEKGIEISMEEVVACSDSPNVRRPHIALAMQKKGYVQSVKEAFDKYLTSEEIEGIKRFKLKDKEAIELIRRAGGIAVLAHPHTLKLSDIELKAKIKQLKEYGLSGVEVYHSDHTKEQMEFYKQIAKDNDLIITCGSDYHGITVKPEIKLGGGINNNLPVQDDRIVIGLIEQIEKEKNNRSNLIVDEFSRI